MSSVAVFVFDIHVTNGEMLFFQKSEYDLIYESGLELSMCYFLSCARLVGVITEYTVPSHIKSKSDAITCFVDVVSLRNYKFAHSSGQKSCAEFLSFYLRELRNEVMLLNHISTLISAKGHESVTKLTGDCIQSLYVNIVKQMEKSNKVERTPIDAYFMSRVDVYSKCVKCKRRNRLGKRYCFVFECSHRYLKNSRSITSQVNTEDLIGAYFGPKEFCIDSRNLIKPINDAHCMHCGVLLEEELELKKEARELIIIYDRVIEEGQKAMNHWHLDDSLWIKEGISSTKILTSAVYHCGRSGRNVTVSLNKNCRSICVFDDGVVTQNKDVSSLLVDGSSNLIDVYGTAVIALYSTENIRKRKNEDDRRVSNRSVKRRIHQYNSKKKSGVTLDFNTSHLEYENYSEDEKKGLFRDYHLDPERAVLFYHFNSGGYAFHNLRDDLSKERNRNKVIAEIKEQFVSREDKENIIQMFETEINGGVNRIPNLITCACCGVREFERGKEKVFSRERGGVRYTEVDVNRLEALRYSEADEKSLKKMIQRGPLCVPIDSLFNEKEIVPETAISFFHDENSDTFYHLHREFITRKVSILNGKKQWSHFAPLCVDCYLSLFPDKSSQTQNNDPKVPKLSIAAGCDFGDFTRIGLTKPNKFEITILSKVRRFLTVVKLSDNTSSRRDYTQSILKGHAVTFDHDAPVVTRNVMESFEKLSGSFKLHLICEDGRRDHLVEKIMGSSIVLGRPFVIYQWLVVLKRLNRLYKYDDIPDVSIISGKTKETNDEVIKEMSVTHDEDILLSELKESDDIAEVRSTVHFDLNEKVHTGEAQAK